MSKLTKKRKKIVESFSFPSQISLAEAIDKIKEYSSSGFSAKFDESIDVNISANLESGQSSQGSVVLPHGNGKKIRVIAFCDDSNAKDAISAGAVKAGLDSLIEEILGGFSDFDKCVATQDVMPTVSKKLAKLLGPKGLLPSPKSGTVASNISTVVTSVLSGQVSFKASKAGDISCSVARVSFDKAKIIENIEQFVSAVRQARPVGAKSFINSIYVSTTMGFGVKVQV